MADSGNCSSCKHRKTVKASNWWCCECQEEYCDSCIEFHKAAKLLKDHSLKKISANCKVDHSKFSTITKCRRHQKPLDYYCPFHDVVICFTCTKDKSDHKECPDTIPIGDVSKDAKLSGAFTNIDENLERLKRCIDEMRVVRLKNKQQLNDQASRLVDEINSIKGITQGKQMELLTEVKTLKDKYIGEIENELRRVDDLTLECSTITERLHYLKEYGSETQVFVAIRDFNPIVMQKERTLQSLASNLTHYNIELKTERSNPIELLVRKEKTTLSLPVYGGKAQDLVIETDHDEYLTYLLLTAGSKGDKPMLKRLHEKRVNMNLRDYDGRTALHLAVAEGQMATVKFLVEEAQVELAIPDRENRHPIDESKDNNNIRTYLQKALQKAENSTSSFNKLSNPETNMTLLMIAASKGVLHTLNDERYKYLMDCQDYLKQSLLHVAAAKAWLKDVKYLLEDKQVSPFIRNSFCHTPLDLVEEKIKFWQNKEIITKNMIGVISGTKLYEGYTQKGEERSRRTQFLEVKKVLEKAIKSASTTEVSEDGDFRNQSEDAKIFLFLNKAYKGDLKSIKRYLLTDPSLLDKSDYDKRTPLHLAAAEGHRHLVEFFLEYRKKHTDVLKNVNVFDRWGATPLVEAMRFGDNDMVSLLLEASS